jgi:hypothetical protein
LVDNFILERSLPDAFNHLKVKSLEVSSLVDFTNSPDIINNFYLYLLECFNASYQSEFVDVPLTNYLDQEILPLLVNEYTIIIGVSFVWWFLFKTWPGGFPLIKL